MFAPFRPALCFVLFFLAAAFNDLKLALNPSVVPLYVLFTSAKEAFVAEKLLGDEEILF